MNEDGTYEIPGENLPGLKLKFEKLAKRAGKLGVPAPTLTVGPRFERKTTEGGGIPRTVTMYPVTVTGEAPRYEGWTMLAVIELDHEEPDSPNVVDVLPGVTSDAAWRTIPEQCDHCHVDNRGRAKLVVVEHESGERKIVGTTCLKDFLGHQSPDHIASWAEVLALLDDTVREYEGIGAKVEGRLDVVEYLSWVVRAIEERGWTPRSASSETRIATSDVAHRLMALAHGAKLDRGEERPEALTEAEVERATAAWAWAKDQGGNDYLDNLAAVAQKTTLRMKHLGVAASAVSAYERALGRELERAEAAKSTVDSKHFGTEGERLEITGKVIGFRELPGYNQGDPARAMVKILTAEGNVAVWWASSAAKAPKMGAEVTGKATVKKHERYEGIAQTTITRASLEVVK